MVLSNVKILDLTQLLPGPFCSKLLADFGAEVVKIERPGIGDLARTAGGPKKGSDTASFHYLNGNKKSLTLDLKTDEGRKVFLDLARGYDVILDSSRPGTMEKMGLGYDQIKEVNPKIIFCSISGFGQSGPYKAKAAHDLNIIGLSGVLDMTGEQGGPPVMPAVQIADIGSALYACIAVLLAIIERERKGTGQYIDISMMDSAISFLSIHAADFFTTGQIPRRGGGILSGGFACYNIYKTKDGRYMTLAGLEPHLWKEACVALGFESLVPKQYDAAVQETVKKEFDDMFSQKTMKEWVEFFKGKNVLCEPVLNIEETFSHPQAIESGIKTKVEHDSLGTIEGLGVPIRFLKLGKMPPGQSPSLGQHTGQILKGLGYKEEQIQNLMKKKVV